MKNPALHRRGKRRGFGNRPRTGGAETIELIADRRKFQLFLAYHSLPERKMEMISQSPNTVAMEYPATPKMAVRERVW